MKLAVVGCGYIAEFYYTTLGNYPDLELVRAYDTNRDNMRAFCARTGAHPCSQLEDILGNPSIEVVLNLTNPRSHYEVTKRCLAAGKHVYSEKPLAMEFDKARELVELASAKGLYLASAPSSVLSETAQTVWKALKDGAIGRVRLIYANFDDGMIAPKLSPWLWQNEADIPWPAKDEFEVGCTYEHAGYLLTWLAAYFGPALKVTSFSSCLLREKGIPVNVMAADFSVGCIEYNESIVARITCSLVAPRDKSLTIIGDDGVLRVADVRNEVCPVYVRRMPPGRWLSGIERRVNAARRYFRVWGSETDWHCWTRCRPVNIPTVALIGDNKLVDFNRGLGELALAIHEKRPCRLSAQLGLHVVEIIEALQYPDRFGGARAIQSTFETIRPLVWNA